MPDIKITPPSSLAPPTDTITASRAARQSLAPPCTKCQRVYIQGKAEGTYDGFKDGQNAGREAGYLVGVR
jgi:flagellar biosynthesis/type III secretory pathway protein FliH